MREFIPLATQFVTLPEGFRLKRGGTLQGARVAYETFGKLSARQDNVILIMTGLSPNAHVSSHPSDPTPGWWEPMVGPGKPIDTDRWRVICVNPLGSCKGSTGPASINPRTGSAYRLDFPELSIEDIADAAAFTVRALGVTRLACVIGASMGGMSSLALTARHPGLARHLVNISGAVHAQPFAIAVRAMQREAIQFDPHWNLGQYDDAHYPTHGMLMARKLGFITYRSAQEWNIRFGRTLRTPTAEQHEKSFDTGFSVEGYLECQAHRFIRSFDPNSYLYLSRSIDWFDLNETSSGLAHDALAKIRLKSALVMGVTTDILFPLHQQRQIADGLRVGGTTVDFVSLDSLAGHDAFLTDTDRVGPPVAEFLSTLSSESLSASPTELLTTA